MTESNAFGISPFVGLGLRGIASGDASAVILVRCTVLEWGMKGLGILTTVGLSVHLTSIPRASKPKFPFPSSDGSEGWCKVEELLSAPSAISDSYLYSGGPPLYT